MLRFLGGFDYLVIDESHYYNPKQLANFLFFLSAWKHFGILDSLAKVCLLSATPNSHVSHYLHSLNLRIEKVSPDNEPADAEALSIPSLAPVELDMFSLDEIREPGLVTLVSDHMQELHQWLGTDQQGAIISSALWRINLLYNELRRSGIPQSRFARLTGVETRQARSAATRYDLILATPTVDLGYNFERTEKNRQSIDFLFFDATFTDEFGRRGYFPLYAQCRTYDALVNGGADIVVNTYATGSGKTKAALLYLHDLRLRSLDKANCLFIAPTNELLEQHARDIEKFCETNALDYQVLRLTRDYMDVCSSRHRSDTASKGCRQLPSGLGTSVRCSGTLRLANKS